jgi:hypothetical protein
VVDGKLTEAIVTTFLVERQRKQIAKAYRRNGKARETARSKGGWSDRGSETVLM